MYIYIYMYTYAYAYLYRPKRCTDAAPDGGAAPRATLARCREAAAPLHECVCCITCM